MSAIKCLFEQIYFEMSTEFSVWICEAGPRTMEVCSILRVRRWKTHGRRTPVATLLLVDGSWLLLKSVQTKCTRSQRQVEQSQRCKHCRICRGKAILEA